MYLLPSTLRVPTGRPGCTVPQVSPSGGPRVRRGGRGSLRPGRMPQYMGALHEHAPYMNLEYRRWIDHRPETEVVLHEDHLQMLLTFGQDKEPCTTSPHWALRPPGWTALEYRARDGFQVLGNRAPSRDACHGDCLDHDWYLFAWPQARWHSTGSSGRLELPIISSGFALKAPNPVPKCGEPFHRPAHRVQAEMRGLVPHAAGITCPPPTPVGSLCRRSGKHGHCRDDAPKPVRSEVAGSAAGE